MKSTMRTILGLVSLALVVGGSGSGPGSDIARALAAPGEGEPDPRRDSDTGRDRARRRRRAASIAVETGYHVDDCYRAISEGRVAREIRAARAANRPTWWVAS